MINLLYLAYGSNLHPLRLRARVPSARLVGVVPLPGRAVRFHKRSDVDGSAKCDLVASDPSDTAYGALYEIAAGDKPGLDAAEGLWSGYAETVLPIRHQGRAIAPFVYLAQRSHVEPSLHLYHWYKALVLAGARYHGLPDHYIAELDRTASISDPDPSRAALNERLLAQIAALA